MTLLCRRLVLREEEKALEVPSQHITERLCFHLLLQLHQVCKYRTYAEKLKIVVINAERLDHWALIIGAIESHMYKLTDTTPWKKF
jgi:hypothetical protein